MQNRLPRAPLTRAYGMARTLRVGGCGPLFLGRPEPKRLRATYSQLISRRRDAFDVELPLHSLPEAPFPGAMR